MNSPTQCSQKDLFSPPMDASGTGPIILLLLGIPAPRVMKDKQPAKRTQNFHIPSFKNSKRWITKLPNGKPLRRPLLITSPEFQEWMKKAVLSLEYQLLYLCRTESGGTRLEPSKLFAMLSRLPADDSVNDLREGSWTVVRVPEGKEGAIIKIERLS